MSVYNERFTFKTPELPDVKFHVLRFSGTEKINDGYKFKIYVIADTLTIKPRDLLAQDSVFSIQSDNGQSAVYKGRCINIVYEGTVDNYYSLSFEFIPKIRLLKYIIQSRIFIDKTLPEIIKEVSKPGDFGRPVYELRLMSNYPVQEFTMQYEENSYDFLRAKMEQQGAYFYIEGAEKVIVADNPKSHAASTFVLHYSMKNTAEEFVKEEILTSFKIEIHTIPGKVVIRNYDWKDPNTMLMASRTTIGEASKFITAVFSNEAVSSQAEAERLVNIRAEEFLSQHYIGKGESHAPNLHPGVIFTLDSHPNADFNHDYMVTEITHEGNQEAYVSLVLGIPAGHHAEKDYYSNSFCCADARLTYRPTRTARRAVVPGFIKAFIDGDDNKAPVLDEFGRYKVLFPFDLSGREKGKASSWIRRAQEQVGKDYGMSFPLLPGTEVTIAFEDGNPDRPFITGALSNGETGSLAGPGNKNFSGIRTPGGPQLVFDNDHNGISMLNNSGSGIKLGSGSMDYLETDTHFALNSASAGSATFTGLFNDTLSGYLNITSSSCLKTSKIIFGLVNTALKSAASVLDSLAANSAVDPYKKNLYDWGSEGAKTAVSIVSFIKKIIKLTELYKGKISVEHNIIMLAKKDSATTIMQCFPTKKELVLNVLGMLIARLGNIGADTADAVKTYQEADSTTSGIESFATTMHTCMERIYDNRNLIPAKSDIEEFYKGDDGTVNKNQGSYYRKAYKSPCAYYGETSNALSQIINALDDKRMEYLEKINDPDSLVSYQETNCKLEELRTLSDQLYAEYDTNCKEEQSKKDLANFTKQSSLRNLMSSSVTSLLPELVTMISLLWRDRILKKVRTGGIFIDALDKNINLHAKSYIGQHAERGIYFNTLQAKRRECEAWGSPVLTGTDTELSNVFDAINNLEVTNDNGTQTTVANLITEAHSNYNVIQKKPGDGPRDKIGLTKRNDKFTFVATRTHLNYIYATNEMHYLGKAYKLIAPVYSLELQDLEYDAQNTHTYRPKPNSPKTTFDLSYNLLTASSQLITLQSLEGNAAKFGLGISNTTASLGVPYNAQAQTLHGVLVTNETIAIAQEKAGTHSSLVLGKDSASLSFKDNNSKLEFQDNQAELKAPEKVIIQGLTFANNQITAANNGQIVFGENTVKITGLPSTDEMKSQIDEEMKKCREEMKKVQDKMDELNTDVVTALKSSVLTNNGNSEDDLK